MLTKYCSCSSVEPSRLEPGLRWLPNTKPHSIIGVEILQKWRFPVLTQRFRRNVSLVLFIALMLTTALFWSLSSATDADLRDGVFTGRGAGFGGEMVVAVTVATAA